MLKYRLKLHRGRFFWGGSKPFMTQYQAESLHNLPFEAKHTVKRNWVEKVDLRPDFLRGLGWPLFLNPCMDLCSAWLVYRIGVSLICVSWDRRA
jgi:hypothetical protein